ncbi:hypothetical protein LX99_03227 [Mucilaginibacter oryzae]|uniref:Lipoprotein n=1 Tax=Mucilaginibacter oryzae TaxID=468058 RepID=A0A316H8T1_9SPHI|nr:hypothetical protein [Mucilaginibacter oryzae]PWK77414.1 hypothetical protein LX99_03227 [Mucilaginibacter oryzae]
MKPIARQLFKTFLFSAIISILVSCAYYAMQNKGLGEDLKSILPSLSESVAFLNIIIFVMSLPTLFLANPAYYNNLSIRLVLYYAGSVVFLITTFRLDQLSTQNKALYFITGVTFIIVHSVFYYLMTRKRGFKR